MSSLKELVADLHKPFSGMIEDDWYEGKDHVIMPDLRSDQEIAEEEARNEVINNHKHD